ncbi:hypothetical protein N658DRAFT_506276 [Parathielavia hyrcaniae]|uniref:Uncharacterized protein n=1 Tax=Parathielavia hyrcaniae TaxID=113614 RepID=A0AAN6Q5L6_9PEZI|nr:hypothetical protein N658DRAFT_506276 [Parathielavia hyrcaniae]
MDSIRKTEDLSADRYLRGKDYEATRRASGYFDEPNTPTTTTTTTTTSRRNPQPPSLDLSRKSKSTSHLIASSSSSRPAAARRTTTSTTAAATPTTAHHRHRHRNRNRTSRPSSSSSSTSLFDPENLAFYTHLATKVSTAAREANGGSTASLRSAASAGDHPRTRAAPYSQRPREDPYERKAYLQPPPPLQLSSTSIATSPTSPSSTTSSSSSPLLEVAARGFPSASSRRHSRGDIYGGAATWSGNGNGNGNNGSGNGYSVPGPRCKPGSVTPRQRAAFARIDGTVEGLEFYFGEGSGASQREVDQFFYGNGEELEEEKEVGGGEACDADGPDFVNLNERLEGLQEEAEEGEAEEGRVVIDKAYLRSLVKEQGRFWPWVASLMVGEARSDEAEDDDEEEEEYGGEVDPYELELRLEEERRKRRAASELRLQECTITPLDATNDPPPDENGGLWRDVSWLLSVAGNALLR